MAEVTETVDVENEVAEVVMIKIVMAPVFSLLIAQVFSASSLVIRFKTVKCSLSDVFMKVTLTENEILQT